MSGVSFQAMIMDGGLLNATITQTDFVKDDTSLTTYTFTTRAIGTADPNRSIVVAVGSPANAANRTISTITLGGSGMNAVGSSFLSSGGGGAFAEVGLYILPFPSGTTATIVVTWSGAADRMAIGIFALYNITSQTPTAIFTSGANPATGSINISAGGVALAAVFAFHASSALSYTWAGLTERYDQQFVATNLAYSGASDQFVTAQTGLTVTATPSVTPAAISMVTAAFR